MNGPARQSALIRASRLLSSVLACLALLALVSGCAHFNSLTADRGPAGPAAVTGAVSSDRGAVVSGAAVRLSGPSFSRHATTDVAGRYTIQGVPLGTYTLMVSAVGYKSAKQKITVDKEAVVHADLKLRMERRASRSAPGDAATDRKCQDSGRGGGLNHRVRPTANQPHASPTSAPPRTSDG